jgi:hypothetical protein
MALCRKLVERTPAFWPIHTQRGRSQYRSQLTYDKRPDSRVTSNGQFGCSHFSQYIYPIWVNSQLLLGFSQSSFDKGLICLLPVSMPRSTWMSSHARHQVFHQGNSNGRQIDGLDSDVHQLTLSRQNEPLKTLLALLIICRVSRLRYRMVLIPQLFLLSQYLCRSTMRIVRNV